MRGEQERKTGVAYAAGVPDQNSFCRFSSSDDLELWVVAVGGKIVVHLVDH